MSHAPTVRSIFISDLHLGYKGADIRSLNAFLSAHPCQYLYLVGDVLDGWKLESRWYWNQDYSDFLDILMDLRERGVKITVLTGNHDEKLRENNVRRARPILRERFGLSLEEQVVHRTKDGRRLLVMHGDQFDSPLLRGTSKHADSMWSRLNDLTWERAERATAGSDVGHKRWSLGKAIATQAKSLIWSYATAAVTHAAASGVDGIICGHSHVSSLTNRGAVLFGNCGSWTGARETGGTHTAVVEKADGRLELLKWPAMRGSKTADRCRNLGPYDPNTRTSEAAILVQLIHGLWMPVRMDASAAPGMVRAKRAIHVAANR